MSVGDPEESYLTVAEVAETLKLNQQTVRNWIDQGSLPALRVGRRVRIKRSDFERILAENYSGTAPLTDAERRTERRGLLGRRAGRVGRAGSSGPPAPNGVGGARGPPMSFSDELDRQRAQIMRAVTARERWMGRGDARAQARAARRRVRRATARARRGGRAEQVAWEHAHAAGLLWRPVPGAENAAPPYELRPDTGRRGPGELWARFDDAVAGLNVAITGSDAAEVADAFGEMAEAAGALADAVTREDAAAEPARGAA